MKKIIIAGGVAGGASAAARLRRLDEDAQIIIYEKGKYVSFANCGLPYHVGGVIAQRSNLILQNPTKFKNSYNIDVRIEHEVMAVHPEGQTVTVKNLATNEEFTDHYDDLIIATGSSPVRPPIPGINSAKVMSLWTIPDADQIKAQVAASKLKKVVVAGGGFIGLELAENLLHLGFEVHLVEMMDQVLAPLDPEMARLVEAAMTAEGIKLHLKTGVSAFTENTSTLLVSLSDGTTIEADFAAVAAGVKPNSTLVHGTGIKLGPRGHIIVDPEMSTGIPHIYAAGDVTAGLSPLTQELTAIPLAGPANKQGRICADNIVTPHSARYRGTIGTSVLKICGLEAASTGLSEKALRQSGRSDFFSVIIRQKDHASYYPGAKDLCLKGIFALDSGKLLGAQAVGGHGADKRIDVLSALLSMGGTVRDLCDIESAYAPPFSSAKDPVNMLGFAAQNKMRGLVSFITPSELDLILQASTASYELIDVREVPEFETFALPKFKNLPLSSLRAHLDEIDRTKPVIITCASGVRSYNAARILMQAGFNEVKSLTGGVGFYRQQHYDSNLPQTPSSTINTSKEERTSVAEAPTLEILDCTGLSCPGPIMKLNEFVANASAGTTFKVKADDPGFAADVKTWALRHQNELLALNRVDGEITVTLKTPSAKGTNKAPASDATTATTTANMLGTTKDCVTPAPNQVSTPKGKTIVVFSDDLDRVLASLVIANGALAMNTPVTLFFTFWGLNAIKKRGAKSLLHKSLVHRMFGLLMPKSISTLKLSKFNFLGLGRHMMLGLMRDKNISTPEDLLAMAQKNGVRLVACSMSMEVMGVSADELIDGVEIGGVASYLGYAEQADTNLFI